MSRKQYAISGRYNNRPENRAGDQVRQKVTIVALAAALILGCPLSMDMIKRVFAVVANVGHRGLIEAEDKIEAMRSAGIAIADSPASLGTTLAGVLFQLSSRPLSR